VVKVLRPVLHLDSPSCDSADGAMY
jgi:hypothetical protein